MVSWYVAHVFSKCLWNSPSCLLLLLLLLLITFMQGIYNYICEINQVSSAYSVAAVLYLQFVLHVMLLRDLISALSAVCSAHYACNSDRQATLHMTYRGADKSLARPGRKQARKHVRDALDFNNIETRAIKFFSSCKARRQRKFTPFWQKL